ncbi:Uma2 family endonuclease [Scytonema sp. NUACC26]|uniref:Uma2 family endonuclease n=1 Tax=Scytonema sp. NUACC26 TaxID=3140176 RepID=UPI0034DBB309
MIQTLTTQKLLTVQEFLEQKPEGRYELHNGTIVEMAQPTGKHENVTGFLTIQLSVELTRLNLPYNIPKTALVAISKEESDCTYSPDVLVLNRPSLQNEELWSKYSTVQLPQSIPLVIEVVSTNWRDDYYKKFGDYEEMGIPEYWIVDYAGLGGRKFLGNPKQPAIFVCVLVDGEYQMTQFRGNDLIISPAFPQLKLTAQQIFDSAL